MTAQILFAAAALATAGAVTQQPAQAPPRTSSSTPDDRLATLAPPAPVVLEGCVVAGPDGDPTKASDDVRLHDRFVLTAVKVVKGAVPAPPPSAAAGGTDYRLDGLSSGQLRLHVGRRVQVDGTFASVDRGAPLAEDEDEAPLAELTATSIRQVPGACPPPRS